MNKTFLSQAGWALYDWANSAFPTVVTTFVFAIYYVKVLAENETAGSTQWSWTISASAICIACLAPFLGAMADHYGRRKPWVLGFTVLCALATLGLWWGGSNLFLLAMVFFGIIGFEMALVFYNAMLPDIVSEKYLGRLSGWAWSLGYVGGLVALLLCLFVLGKNNVPDMMLLVAIWTMIFSIPFFIFTKDKEKSELTISEATKKGLKTLWHTVRNLKTYQTVLWFLLSHMIYRDGLNTLFSLGGVFAGVAFDMQLSEVLTFGIVLNITAGLGAFVFASLDDKWGSKTAVVIALVGLSITGGIVLLLTSKTWFWVVGCTMGLFMGATQSSSRSLMARIAPKNMTTEMFGLFAMSGKATAFLGPFLVGAITFITGSYRMGMTIIIVFLLLGLLLLVIKVKTR